MKKFNKFFLAFLAVSLVCFTACKDDDDDVTPNKSSFDILTTYMVNNDMDLPDILDGWITARPDEADLTTFLGTYDIFDLRSAADFASGHIEGAINTTLTTLLTDAAAASGKPILVVCYTGQTAGHAVVALRLSGYSDAKVLKWGMSGWDTNLASKWQSNSGDNGNAAVGHDKWTTASTATPQTFDAPAWTAVSSDPSTILAERVNTMLSSGFKGTSCADILGHTDNYFINNYWAQTDVDTYGHIDGAYRIHPMSIATGELSNLDPNKTVATYCWTGQTSSMITAYLNVLGYDATSLKFGANSMIYSELQSHKYSTPTTSLPVVTD